MRERRLGGGMFLNMQLTKACPTKIIIRMHTATRRAKRLAGRIMV